MIRKILLFLLVSCNLATVFGQKNFENVLTKTWHEETGFDGITVVFVKTDSGQLKVFRQNNGSGLPVVSTEVFDVEVKQDTIFLLTPKQKETYFEKIIYTYNDNQGLLRDGKPLKIIQNEPIIYLFTEDNKLIGEPLNTNKITRYEFNKNKVLVNEKIFIINPKEK